VLLEAQLTFTIDMNFYTISAMATPVILLGISVMV
jgi:hypothetical protein